MNIIAKRILTAALLLAAGVAPLAQAHGWEHGGHGWGGGPRWSIGLNFGYPLYDPYPAPYYGYYGAPVVYANPPVVVAPPPPSQVVYQYYCPASGAYYPSVPTCSQPWLKVLPDGSAYN